MVSLLVAFIASYRDCAGLLRQLRRALRGTCSRCCCTCSRPGRRSTWSTSTWCARVTTRSARSSIPNGMYGRWNWRGLAAYVAGFVAMIPFFSTDDVQGPVARALGGADIAMLVGLPVAAGVYLLACRSIDLPARANAAPLPRTSDSIRPSPQLHGRVIVSTAAHAQDRRPRTAPRRDRAGGVPGSGRARLRQGEHGAHCARSRLHHRHAGALL